MEIHSLHVKVGDSLLFSLFQKHRIKLGATVHRFFDEFHHVSLFDLRDFVLESLILHLLLLLFLQNFDVFFVSGAGGSGKKI